MEKTITAISCIITILIFSSCGANYKLRKANRLIKKAELQGALWKVDTVFSKIPVFVNSVTVDTLLVAQPSDTITLTRDRLTVKFVDLPGDTVWISGHCDSLTIIKEVPVRVEKVIYAPQNGLKLWQWILIALAVGLILGILIRR